jgi:hypothetical protein
MVASRLRRNRDDCCKTPAPSVQCRGPKSRIRRSPARRNRDDPYQRRRSDPKTRRSRRSRRLSAEAGSRHKSPLACATSRRSSRVSLPPPSGIAMFRWRPRCQWNTRCLLLMRVRECLSSFGRNCTGATASTPAEGRFGRTAALLASDAYSGRPRDSGGRRR